MSVNVPDVDAIRRSQMLVRAARCGLPHYRRENDLPRVLGTNALPLPGRALDALIDIEAEIDAARRGGLGAYDILEHVEVLTALLAGARIVRPGGVEEPPLPEAVPG